MSRKRVIPDSGRYSTGKPCVNGHIAERRVIDRRCVECAKARSLRAMKRWRTNNPEKARARNRIVQAKRKAAKLQRIPLWVDLEAIDAFYLACPDGMHVDHIVPLQGDNVSGLHVLNNLQYLEASENLSKSNSFAI